MKATRLKTKQKYICSYCEKETFPILVPVSLSQVPSSPHLRETSKIVVSNCCHAEMEDIFGETISLYPGDFSHDRP